MYDQEATNVEGLTWEEWSYAAGLSPDFVLAPSTEVLYERRNAWRAGEDPTEWRVS